MAAMVILACLAASGTSISTAAPPKDLSSEFRVGVWKSEKGLPQNNVRCILQTHDGYLWIGTYFGIARFDGVKFTVFDKANTPEMTSEAVPAMAEDLDGSLWIATHDGLVRRKNGRFTRYTKADGLPEDAVWLLCPSRNGGVWLGTGHGLGFVQAGKCSCYTTLDGLKENGIKAIYEDPQGNLLVGTARGIQRFDPVSRRFMDFTSGLGWPDQNLTLLLEDQPGNFWAGTDKGLRRLQHGRWTTLTARDGLPHNSVTSACKARAGGMWVVTQNERPTRLPESSLSRIDDDRITQVKIGGMPANLDVNCLCEDREGNLWLGTVGEGLIRLQPRRLKTFTTQDGLAYDDVWSVCEGNDGSIWVGTGYGLSRIQDGEVTSYTATEPSPEWAIRSVSSDRKGNVWIVKSGLGLLLFKDGTFARANYIVGPLARERYVRTVYEDREGAMWFGGDTGVIRFKDNQSTRYGKQDGLPAEGVRAILQDRSGTLWFGTYGGGLCKFRDGRFTVVTTKDGLSNNRAWALYEDADGALWIGTEHGLNRYKYGRFFVYTTQEGLFDDLINQLLEDDFGNFWISCNRGIYRVSRKELNEVADGKATSVRYAAYGEADGMLSAETNGEAQPAGCKAHDGRLWFPTNKGVVVIDPKSIKNNEVPPPVVIEQVRADEEVIFGYGVNEEYKVGDQPPPRRTEAPPRREGARSGVGGRVPSDSQASIINHQLKPGRARVLEIQYTANSFVAPEKVRFKYRLEGHDADWRDAGNRRVAYYTDLAPGQYNFVVKACNNHGYWNETGDVFAFYLAPHFYQTWAFYVVCAGAVIGMGWGLHLLRLNVVHKLQRLGQAAALAEQRARFAQDMHDDIGASLTKIALLSEVARENAHQPAVAEAQTAKISTIAGETVNSLSELIWVTNPKFDTLENLVAYLREYVAGYLDATDIRWQLNFPATVPSLCLTSEFRRNLFLVVKEALHNIIKHSAASEAEVGLTVGSSSLELWVADNGRGFLAEAASSRGNGLLNMRQRVSALGGHFDLQSPPMKGTRISITVPLT